VWKSRNLRLLVSGATVSAIGNGIAPVALAYAVVDLGGTPSELGLVVGAYALAQVLTTLVGGVLGDRLPRAVLLEGSSVVSAIAQGLVAASLIGQWSSILFLGVISLFSGIVSAIGGPSSASLTPLTVPATQLSSAISIRRLFVNGGMILGFSIAGYLVAAHGSGYAIAVDAASFLIAAICFQSMHIPHSPPERAESLGRSLAIGAREVLRHTWLWAIIGQALIYHLVFDGAQAVLGPIMIGRTFGRAAWGTTMAALVLGFVVGGLVTLRWRPTRSLLVGTLMLTLTAAFPLAIALSPELWVLMAGAFLHGLGLEIFGVWWDLSIQQNVAPDKLARVYSLDVVGSFVARPVGLALVGPVAEAVGETRWLVIVAVVIASTTLLMLLLPDVRRLQRR
jgi:MFS family permease